MAAEENIIGRFIGQSASSTADFATYFFARMISDGMIDPGGLQRMLREMSQQKEGDEYTVIALSAQRILNNLGANDAGYNVRSKLIQKNGKYRVAVEVRRRIGKFRRVE